jgi:hypothetical protein
MHHLNIPRVSFSIIEGDQNMHLRDYIQACPVGEVPALQTPLLISSLSKSFITPDTTQPFEARQFKLDAPDQNKLPRCHVAEHQAFSNFHLPYRIEKVLP